jgi:hypothetical protein
MGSIKDASSAYAIRYDPNHARPCAYAGEIPSFDDIHKRQFLRQIRKSIAEIDFFIRGAI